MQEADVVLNLLLPANQQPTSAVDPGVCTFDFPTAGFAASVLWFGWCVAFGGEMGLIATAMCQAFHGLSDIAFVEAKMLRLTLRRLGTLAGNILQRLLHQFLVVHVGSVHRRSNRDASTIDQDRTLDPNLAAIRRVFAGFFPRRAAICSARRPSFATPNRFPFVRRILPKIHATTFRTLPVEPNLESKHEWHCPNRILGASLSTDSPCAGRIKFQSRRFVTANAACPLFYNWFCNVVTTVQFCSTGNRESGETGTLKPLTSTHLRAKKKPFLLFLCTPRAKNHWVNG